MMTVPMGSRAARSSATASTVSCTGISSSSVTTCTAVCGEVSISVIESACERIGPIFARPDTSSLTERNRTTRPVGGASRMIASYAGVLSLREWRPVARRRFASYTLPVSSTSRTPGAMVVAKSTAPNRSRTPPARPSL
jgi:hypothetical protein